MNNISVKGPSLRYSKSEITNYFSIYQFVIKYLINFN